MTPSPPPSVTEPTRDECIKFIQACAAIYADGDDCPMPSVFAQAIVAFLRAPAPAPAPAAVALTEEDLRTLRQAADLAQVNECAYLRQRLLSLAERGKAHTPRTMTTATCILCKAVVPTDSQSAHLALSHAAPAGGFKFWFDAKAYFTQAPSMSVAEIKRLVGTDPGYAFFERAGNHERDPQFSDGQSVDLTREPKFYACPPATF